MRTRPMLHEAENEAEAKTYAEAAKFGLEDLTSLLLIACTIIQHNRSRPTISLSS